MKEMENEKVRFREATEYFDYTVNLINNGDFPKARIPKLLYTLVIMLYWNMKVTALLLEDKKEHEVH